MSQDDSRALVERYFTAFNDHSIDGMLACLDEDVAHDVNQGERRIGIAKFKDFKAADAGSAAPAAPAKEEAPAAEPTKEV